MMKQQPDQEQHVEKRAELPPGERSGERPGEFGGRKGLEPTRYGDWEKNGRCIDF